VANYTLVGRISSASESLNPISHNVSKMGKIQWGKVPYMLALEALNSVNGIGHFSLEPPKFGGPSTRAP